MSIGISIQGIIKEYYGSNVLNIKNTFIEKGYVYGLVGNNGVGKTTLLEIIEGSLKPDLGNVDTMGMSIGMVHHNAGLFNELTVYENMFMGREPMRVSFGPVKAINWKRVKEDAQRILDQFHLEIDIHARVHDLDLSQQKLLETIIAISKEPDILIVDEPLTFLDLHQIEYMNALVKEYINEDRIVIYSSHRMDELFSAVDKVIVMRDKTIVSIDDATDNVLAGMLEFSETVLHKYPKREVPLGGFILEVEGLKADYVDCVDFKLREGEILGIVGLRGAYKSQIGKALFGAITSEGHIRIAGNEKRIRSTKHAVEAGICYMGNTNQGVFLDDSVIENVVSANVPRARKLSRSAKRLISKHYLEMMNINSDDDKKMDHLSSGNKQKVILAKWFFSKSKIFIFNKPTSNIDAVSKVDIYNIIVDLASSGAGLLLISNDLEEIAGMCDRVLVVEAGKIKTEILRDNLSVHKLVEEMQNW